jgi:diguanylate cyclase
VSEHFQGSSGFETARRAIDEMERRGISVSPENYAVWATHVAGSNPALSHDVATALVEAGDETSALEEASRQLYAKHFNEVDFGEEVMETSSKVSEELEAALATIKDAGKSTADYGKALAVGTNELTKADASPDALRAVIQSLTSATKSMRKRSVQLEEKLKETTTEVHNLRENLEKIQEEAQTDGLTGLYNRRLFDRKMQQICSDGWSLTLCLVMLDIDHFKNFNDTWGHQTGDQIIRFTAQVIKKFADPHHVCARYGGEEFAIIMPATRIRDAEFVAEQIRHYVEGKKLKRRSTDEDLGKVTISIGIGECHEGEAVEELIERTDKALYASKQNGRNRTTVAPPGLSQAAA